MNLGQVAYEAYSKAAGRKSLISGAKLLKWKKLPENIQNAWIAAGVTVGNVVMNETLENVTDSVQEAAQRGFEGIQHDQDNP